MRALVDSSILVPSFVKTHIHYRASRRLFLASRKSTTVCAAHSLSETYARLTGSPIRPKVSPAQALLFIDEVKLRMTPVALTESEYGAAIEDAASVGIAGGAIYDFLIARCALKAEVDVIYTWNLKDFLRFGGGIAEKVRTPGE